jgi:hypothetical protein
MDNAQGNYAQGSGDCGRRDCEHCGLKDTPYCDMKACKGSYAEYTFLFGLFAVLIAVWVLIMSFLGLL